MRVRPWRWLHGAAPRRCDLIATYAAVLVVAWATWDVSVRGGSSSHLVTDSDTVRALLQIGDEVAVR